MPTGGEFGSVSALRPRGALPKGTTASGDGVRSPMCGNRTETVETDALEVVRVGSQEIVSIARINNAATKTRQGDRHLLDLLYGVMIRHSIHAGHGLL